MAKLQLDLNTQTYMGAQLVSGVGGQPLVCYSWDGFHVFMTINDAVRLLNDTVDIEEKAVADGIYQAPSG